jgi:hypothetical protein
MSKRFYSLDLDPKRNDFPCSEFGSDLAKHHNIAREIVKKRASFELCDYRAGCGWSVPRISPSSPSLQSDAHSSLSSSVADPDPESKIRCLFDP